MNKNQYYQMIRGVCIISVIIIHLLSRQENEAINSFNIILRTVVNFCVGVFVFLSGYFVNIEKIKKDKRKWMLGRLKRVGIPFLIFSTIAATIAMMKNGNSIMGYIIDILIGSASAQLYYIVVLIQLIILTPILVKIINSKKRYLNIIIIAITPVYLLLLAILNINYNMQLPQYQTIFFAWIIYYYLGIYYKMNKERIEAKLKPIKCLKYVYLPLLIVFSIINLYMYKLGVNYSYVTSQVKILNMIYIVLAIILIIKYSKNSNKTNWLTNLGDLSFGIYFIHTYFITIYNHIFYFNNYFINLVIGIIFVVLLSYFSIIVFKKLTKNKFDKILGF